MTGPDSADNRPATQTEMLREEIRQTRADLGATVQALAAKADVKARVRRSATGTAHRVRESAGQTADRVRYMMAHPRTHPVPWIAVAAGAAVLVVMLVARGRRR